MKLIDRIKPEHLEKIKGNTNSFAYTEAMNGLNNKENISDLTFSEVICIAHYTHEHDPSLYEFRNIFE
jgi:hypothetical protein